MWLRSLLDRTEYKTDDTFKRAMLKGLAEGALEGLIIVGAMDIVCIGIDAIMKSKK